MTMIMVVQSLPIDRGDDREGELVIVGESDFRNGSRYIRLPDSRTYGTHGSQVHIGGYDTGFLDLGDFFLALIIPLVYDTHDERYGRFLRTGYDTQPLE